MKPSEAGYELNRQARTKRNERSPELALQASTPTLPIQAHYVEYEPHGEKPAQDGQRDADGGQHLICRQAQRGDSIDDQGAPPEQPVQKRGEHRQLQINRDEIHLRRSARGEKRLEGAPCARAL